MINIFYACDDNFIKYTVVSLRSLIDNASDKNEYCVHILNVGISQKAKQIVDRMQTKNVKIVFDDVSSYLKTVSDNLPIRDYYTKTTYFRLFIAEMFPAISKAIYIDSDTVLLADIADLYAYDLGGNLVGACNEQVMIQEDCYGTYVEEVMGINRHLFFNAGLLLINCDMFREKNVLMQFVRLLNIYTFKVTQDEDYLNVICKDRVFWLPQCWNTEVFKNITVKPCDIKMIHYIMTSKPWYYPDCPLKEHFWSYAKKTEVYEELLCGLKNHSLEDKAHDAASGERLMELAKTEIMREDSYFKCIKATRSPERETVLKKIEELEASGRFDEDVESDPPSKEILPGTVDYMRKKIRSKVKAKVAFMAARKHLARLINKGDFILEDIKGVENFANLNCGAIITCNHFNAFDSFAIQLAYYASKHKKRKFFRVIREGNYTSFPSFYGFLMRNCYTLPLSSNFSTMKEFVESINLLLQNGHFVLFYPEQSMWWNYRKPKPLKDGAYRFAAKNNVPVLPCFITMRDGEKLDENGYPSQEYTINIGEPIYPNAQYTIKDNIEYMKNENYNQWKKIYEETYGLPLTYSTLRAT